MPSRSVEEIAKEFDGEVIGDGSIQILGVSSLAKAESSQLAYFGGGGYKEQFLASQAGCVFVKAGFDKPDGVGALIVVEDPNDAFTRYYSALLLKAQTPEPGVHATAVVHESATIADSAYVGPYAVIGKDVTVGAGSTIHSHVALMEGVTIGERCTLYPHCVLREFVSLGNEVLLQPGVVLGADGFGYVIAEGRLKMVPQLGNVELGDDVHIGANSTVDRARFATTSIGAGTKIDNLVQIGHNVEIGKLCGIAGLSGIAGSATIGDFCNISGGVTVADTATVGQGSRVLGRSSIAGDIPAGATVLGTPAKPHREEIRLLKLIEKLPDLFKAVSRLEKMLSNEDQA